MFNLAKIKTQVLARISQMTIPQTLRGGWPPKSVSSCRRPVNSRGPDVLGLGPEPPLTGAPGRRSIALPPPSGPSAVASSSRGTRGRLGSAR